MELTELKRKHDTEQQRKKIVMNVQKRKKEKRKAENEKNKRKNE